MILLGIFVTHDTSMYFLSVVIECAWYDVVFSSVVLGVDRVRF